MMEFIYNFAKGHSEFIYVSKEGEVLDAETWAMIADGNLGKYLLPVSMQKEMESHRFTYNIAGMINMMAWKDSKSSAEQMEMDRSIEAAISALSFRGVPREEIIGEQRYMYVQISTGNVKLVCIPVRKEEREYVPQGKETVSEKQSRTPLPLIPPEPKGNLADEFIFEEQKEPVSYPWKEETSDKSRDNIQENVQEDNVWENVSFGGNILDKKPWEMEEISGETPKEEPEEHREADVMDEEANTVFLRDDGDSPTVLLKQPQIINGKLIRVNTQEIFSVKKENCKIGKRALMADICIRNNPTISREHCVIRFRDGEYYLEDLNSSNYTYLNGIRVMPSHPEKLENEDKIRLSDEEFIFRKGE